MDEWICLNCKKVFLAGKSYAKCCGEIELFDPQKHGESLVPLSNGWSYVEDAINSRYNKHPLYKKTFEEHVNKNNYGASSIFLDFVDRLIDNYVDNKE